MQPPQKFSYKHIFCFKNSKTDHNLNPKKKQPREKCCLRKKLHHLGLFRSTFNMSPPIHHADNPGFSTDSIRNGYHRSNLSFGKDAQKLENQHYLFRTNPQ
jgi:hypothetical protein